jgi:hypothetical protein
MDMRKVTFGTALALMFGGFLFGLTISKYSARVAYDLGYETAFNQHENSRMQTCMAWWFDDSARRIEQARIWMCGNDLRKKR